MENRSALSAAGAAFREEGMSSRVKNIVTSPIKEMMLLAAKTEEPYYLAQGIPAEDCAPHIKAAMVEAVNGPVASKYSLLSGMQECRDAVAKRYKDKYNVEIDPNTEIGITAGCMEACMISVMSIVNPGDEVIIIAPDFASHIEEVLAAEGVPVYVNTKEEEGWLLNLDEVEAAITDKTKAIFVTNPNNPTGAVFPEEQVRGLCNIALKHNLFIIADETYDYLTYEDTQLFSFSQVPEIRKNLFLTCSASKEYNMTGYRLGWVITAPDILTHLFKLHDATTVCACVVSQFGFIAAVNGPQDSVKEAVAELAERRKLICERIDRIPHLFSYQQKPMGAYYILPKIIFPHENSVEATLRILKETGVVTVPGIAFGPSAENHLRFSFAGGATRGPIGNDLINQAFDKLEAWGKQFQ